MPKAKSNKFNKSTRQGGREPFKNFPIKQFRFKTTHPIHNSTVKCSHRIGSMWSQQEELMVMGLSNILQCEARQAIRIAIFEACLTDTETLKPFLTYALSTSKEQGHTSRNKKGSISLPKEEKQEFTKLSKKLSITDKEAVRLSIIWLSKCIRDESITRITNSTRINQLKLRQQWTEDNPDKASKPSTIQPLIDAQKKALNELEELKYSEQELEDTLHDTTLQYLSENPGLGYRSARNIIELELSESCTDPFEEFIKEEAKNQGLSHYEEKVYRYMSLGLTAEEAETAVSQEQEEPLTDEEEKLLMEELEQMSKEGESDKSKKPLSLRKSTIRNKYPDFDEKLAYLRRLGDTEKSVELSDENKKRISDHNEMMIIHTFFDELYPDT